MTVTSVAAGWLSETVNLAVSPSVTEPEAGPVMETRQVSSAPGVPPPGPPTSSVTRVVTEPLAGSAAIASKPLPVISPTETVMLSEPSASASSIVLRSKSTELCPAGMVTEVTAV